MSRSSYPPTEGKHRTMREMLTISQGKLDQP
jgi:hypothetical protein